MKLPLILTAVWATLCLAGSWLVAVGIEDGIRQQAAALLHQTGAPAAKVTAVVSGRRVTLTGTVTQPDTAANLEALMRRQVCAPHAWMGDTQLSLVTAVDRSGLHTDLRPTGWGLLLADAKAAVLHGLCSSEAEGLRIAAALRPLLSGVTLTTQLQTDPERCAESDRTTADLLETQGFTPSMLRAGMAAYATWGGRWTLLDLSRPLEHTRQLLLTAGVDPELWEEALAPAMQKLLDHQASLAAADAEQRRLASQAGGHVVLALRADTVLVKGELGSTQAVDLVMESIHRHASGRRVITELLHDPYRRPEPDLRRLTHELPQLPTGNTARLVAVGTADSGWQVLPLADLDPEDANSVMPGMLPKGLDRRLALGDLMDALVWCETSRSRPGEHMSPAASAYILLAFAGQRLMAQGRVPDELTRAQIAAALKERYAQLEQELQLRVDPRCEAAGSVLQTLALLPPTPEMDTSGQLAIALLGREWTVKPARASLLEPGTLAQAGFLPRELSINELLPDILAITPTLKQHFRLHEATMPAGIPQQSIGPR